MRVLLVSVEGDRSAEGIGQGSRAIGLCDDDDGGGGLPCPFVAVAVDADRCPGVGVGGVDDAVGAGVERLLD